jgi:SNF2 family DNA or RNA helicase
MKDTVEARVLALQEQKINLAGCILDATKKTSASGAGLNAADMRMLFGLGRAQGK